MEEVTLTVQQIPATLIRRWPQPTPATSTNAGGNLLAQVPSYTPYIVMPPNSALSANAVGQVGGGQPHTNFQPYLCVTFIISLFGIFPSPT